MYCISIFFTYNNFEVTIKYLVRVQNMQISKYLSIINRVHTLGILDTATCTRYTITDPRGISYYIR